MNRLPVKPLIYCISEGLADESNFQLIKEGIVNKVRNAARCGVAMFQIREKKLTSALLFELISAAVDAARGTGVKLLVNDRTDLALAAGADGVHLPSDGIPVREVRRIVPDLFIVGLSTHSIAETAAAKMDDADFAVFGTVFASPGKGSGVGLNQLSLVVDEAVSFPVLALGGIDEVNAHEVLRRGAAGYASIRYLNECISSESQAVR